MSSSPRRKAIRITCTPPARRRLSCCRMRSSAPARLDKKKVRDALAATNVTTFYGPIKFSANGMNEARDLPIIQVQDKADQGARSRRHQERRDGDAEVSSTPEPDQSSMISSAAI